MSKVTDSVDLPDGGPSGVDGVASSADGPSPDSRWRPQISVFSERVAHRAEAALRPGGPTSELLQDGDALRAALDELRWQHEQLVLADTELRAQLDELTSAASALEAERTRWRRLFDAIGEGALETDQGGVVLEANAAAGQIFGVEPRYLVGKPLSAFARADDGARLNTALAELQGRAEFALELDLSITTRSGEVRPLHFRAKNVDAGRLLWLCHRNDSSEHAARAPHSPRAGGHEGDTAARERPAQAVANELRAPAHAILGWTALLRHGDLDRPTMDRGLDAIERNTRVQAELVDTLLDLTRVVSQKLSISRASVDLTEIVEDVIDAQQGEASRKNVLLGADLQKRVVVHGDADRLAQIATHLVTHALRATSPGGRVHVRVERRSDLGSLTVTDTGRGIRPDALPHVFDYFQSGKDAGAIGPGLSLFLVKRLVELHDGSVWADSKGEGRGATYTAVFPIGER